jgi:23S rRNA-/tRNA-specific pseudouridylate synthase
MNTDKPYIIKEYDDVYFIYKPPYWNCTTPDKGSAKDFIKQYKGHNLILDWIYKNVKLPKELIDTTMGLLNRLDFETSGIIMVAKTLNQYKLYRQNINNHLTTLKIYITLVNGSVEHQFGVVSLPLTYDQKKRVTKIDEDRGKYAYTEYIKLKTIVYKDKIYTLLAVKIKTGRTHQIRTHMKAIGHVVFCDKTYDQNKENIKNECALSKRLFLHATYYKLKNNIDGQSKLPKDLENTINAMIVKHQFTTLDNAIDIFKSNVITDKFITHEME